MTAETTVPSTPEVAASGNGLVPLNFGKGEKVNLTVSLPKALREKVGEDASAAKTTPNTIVRDLVAAKYGFRIVGVTRVRMAQKYGSKEERLAAERARQQTRRETVSNIMGALMGDLTPEQKAALASMGINVEKIAEVLPSARSAGNTASGHY